MSIAAYHRRIEKSHRTDFEGLAEEVDSFCTELNGLKPETANQDMAFAIKMLAMGNAVQLSRKEVKADTLVEWVSKPREDGYDSYQIYFGHIAPEVHR